MNKDKKLFILQLSVINVTVLATDSFQGFRCIITFFSQGKRTMTGFQNMIINIPTYK